jgi:prolyl-tRNA synthetase
MLVRAGFIRQAHSGLFHYLPLWLKIQEKVEGLLDKHMQNIGASKLSLSTLSSEALWAKSGRLQGGVSEFFRLEDRKGAKYLLSPTHEEEMTSIVASAVHSYKELPIRAYQITRKYRDELRPRGGLLRSREFLMKDLYTFDTSQEAALETYAQVRAAYARFFAEFKLPIVVAEADSGTIGGDLSHEYHLVSKKGEDAVFQCGGCGFAANEEVLNDPRADRECPKCHKPALIEHKAIELGHTFYLGTKYSEPLGAKIAAEKGSTAKENLTAIEMGCHGIGVSRMIASIADVLSDDRGLNWPAAMAPFDAVVVHGKGLESDAESVYNTLTASQPLSSGGPTSEQQPRSLDVTVDVRDKEMGWKLKDADLIGYPVIIVLGRTWATGRECEVQCRRLGVKQNVSVGQLRDYVCGLLDKL